jgi:hypothetical protein
MKKRIGLTTDPITVETLHEELNLMFKRLHIQDDDKSYSSKEVFQGRESIADGAIQGPL